MVVRFVGGVVCFWVDGLFVSFSVCHTSAGHVSRNAFELFFWAGSCAVVWLRWLKQCDARCTPLQKGAAHLLNILLAAVGWYLQRYQVSATLPAAAGAALAVAVAAAAAAAAMAAAALKAVDRPDGLSGWCMSRSGSHSIALAGCVRRGLAMCLQLS
jgi:hypothetical protein